MKMADFEFNWDAHLDQDENECDDQPLKNGLFSYLREEEAAAADEQEE